MKALNHTKCHREADLTSCGQHMSIVGDDAHAEQCGVCVATDQLGLCPLGGNCSCDDYDDPNDADHCDDCDCSPCRCDTCGECERDVDSCECSNEEVYDCGCEAPCSCGDCWDCHDDRDCDCCECQDRISDDPKAPYVTWSDKHIWKQIFLDEGGFSDRATILKHVGRTVAWDYHTVRGADGTIRSGQESHYDSIMSGFRRSYVLKAREK